MKDIKLWVVAAVALVVPSVGSTNDAALGETVTEVAAKAIANVPGKRLVSLIVD
jgi:hypothetical protein